MLLLYYWLLYAWGKNKTHGRFKEEVSTLISEAHGAFAKYYGANNVNWFSKSFNCVI